MVPGMANSHQGAPLSSKHAIKIIPKGTYSAKFPWARIALSRSSWPPLPKPTLFFLRRPITANESLIKIMVKAEAMIEVTNSTDFSLDYFQYLTEGVALIIGPFTYFFERVSQSINPEDIKTVPLSSQSIPGVTGYKENFLFLYKKCL